MEAERTANYELKFVWLVKDFQIVMYSLFDAKRLKLSIMRKEKCNMSFSSS